MGQNVVEDVDNGAVSNHIWSQLLLNILVRILLLLVFNLLEYIHKILMREKHLVLLKLLLALLIWIEETLVTGYFYHDVGKLKLADHALSLVEFGPHICNRLHDGVVEILIYRCVLVFFLALALVLLSILVNVGRLRLQVLVQLG